MGGTSFAFPYLDVREAQRLFIIGLLVSICLCQGCASMVNVSESQKNTPTDSIINNQEAQDNSPKPAQESRVSKTADAPQVQSGKASWYGPGLHGKLTASGETFDQTAMTAAHNSLPLGSKAKVTNLSNGRSVEVRINDRGPFVPDRIIDLSRAAARAIGILDRGITWVRVELIGASRVK